MKRQECEYLIGCLLEDIRRVVRMYDESIDHVSLTITECASRASAIKECDNEEIEYLLKVDVLKGDENDVA